MTNPSTTTEDIDSMIGRLADSLTPPDAHGWGTVELPKGREGGSGWAARRSNGGQGCTAAGAQRSAELIPAA
jgi:hypothetical protein